MTFRFSPTPLFKGQEVLAGQYAATPENVALIRRTVQMGITSLQVSGRQVQGLPSGTTRQVHILR